MAVGLEEQRVALDGASDLAAAGEAKLAVEFAGLIEAEDVFWLLGEEVLGLGDESEEGVPLYDVLEVKNAIRLRLNQFGSGAFLLSAFLLEFFGDFGDQKRGGGERGGGKWLIGVRVRFWD